jgi:excinuclease ABC subunit C
MNSKPTPKANQTDRPSDDFSDEDDSKTLELDIISPEEPVAALASVEAGASAIRRFWKTLPNSPGVYRMLDKAGEVLYVGKAKRLKMRVASYTRTQGHSNRINRMIAQTVSMEFVVTETETEALLLETNYIKQFRPRFNVLMRDGKMLHHRLSNIVARVTRKVITMVHLHRLGQ